MLAIAVSLAAAAAAAANQPVAPEPETRQQQALRESHIRIHAENQSAPRHRNNAGRSNQHSVPVQLDNGPRYMRPYVMPGHIVRNGINEPPVMPDEDTLQQLAYNESVAPPRSHSRAFLYGNNYRAMRVGGHARPVDWGTPEQTEERLRAPSDAVVTPAYFDRQSDLGPFHRPIVTDRRSGPIIGTDGRWLTQDRLPINSHPLTAGQN